MRKEGHSANLCKIKHFTCPWHTKHFLLIWPTIDTILDDPLGPASCRSQLQPHGAIGWWLTVVFWWMTALVWVSFRGNSSFDHRFWYVPSSFQTKPVVLGVALYLGPVNNCDDQLSSCHPIPKVTSQFQALSIDTALSISVPVPTLNDQGRYIKLKWRFPEIGVPLNYPS